VGRLPRTQNIPQTLTPIPLEPNRGAKAAKATCVLNSGNFPSSTTVNTTG
jgi:hypothetical protein